MQRFNQEFKQLDQPVSEAQLTGFLDNNAKGGFDRDVFDELVYRAKSRYGSLTPHSFARVYFEALETLKRKSEHTMADLNNIDYSIRLAREEQMARLEFRHLRLDNPSDPANFVTIDMTRNCAINFYNLQDEQDFLFVPVALLRRNEPLRVTLQNLRAHIVDSKNVDVMKEAKQDYSEVVFLDGSTLSYSLQIDDVSRQDCLAFLVARKNDLQEYQVHTATKNALLIETFPDVFAGAVDVRQAPAVYSATFRVACYLTAAMAGLSLFLNVSRCYFFEIFVACAFLGSVYGWRSFSVFFALRLIGILAVSIVVDLVWGYIEAFKLAKNYDEPIKYLRIFCFVLGIFNLLIKGALVYFYDRVSKEENMQGHLRLNDDTFWAEKGGPVETPTGKSQSSTQLKGR